MMTHRFRKPNNEPVGNKVISYSLRGIEVFLKVPVIIIIRFGENNTLGIIYIYILLNVPFRVHNVENWYQFGYTYYYGYKIVCNSCCVVISGQFVPPKKFKKIEITQKVRTLG